MKCSDVHEGPISVAIADGSEMGCDLLAGALKRCRYHFKIVGAATTSTEAAQLVLKYEPAIALVSADLQDGKLKGLRVLSEIRTSNKATRTVMLLNSPQPPLILEAFRNGAKGVLYRNEPLPTLCKSIYCVHKGQIWAKSLEMEIILQDLERTHRPRATASEIPLLTSRETQVVRMVVTGVSNREIAGALNLSEHTVKNYLFRIFEKLGVSHRAELASYAMRFFGQREGEEADPKARSEDIKQPGRSR